MIAITTDSSIFIIILYTCYQYYFFYHDNSTLEIWSHKTIMLVWLFCSLNWYSQR